MIYKYNPQSVCSSEFTFEIEDNKVKSFTVIGGCHGNLQGIGKLLEGMDIDEVITRLEGIRCGFKNTSCPDQIAKSLKSFKNR